MSALLLILFGICSFSYSLELKQVLILSRHNLRTPLTENLQTMSPKVWPKWKNAPGELTEKGALLEGYVGEYFSEWLAYHRLLNGCQNEDIHVYANTRQRTRETAKAFVNTAFRDCNILIHFRNTTEMDPVFNPVIHNTTEAFKQLVISEMNEKLNCIDLSDVYLELNRITDIKESPICKKECFCDLANEKTEVVYQVGMEPDVDGPLKIANSMVDAFLMSYYEGFALEDIAWGEIKSEKEWTLLAKIAKENQNVRFNTPKASRDYAKPLLRYMNKMLHSSKKFTLLVGHDSNLNPVITALEFKPFTLPGQLEISPTGAKLVFQKWSDGVDDFLRVEYVYETWHQIRNAEKLSMMNPPKNITMYLKNLSDDNGFYLWSDFERILNDVTE